MSEGPTWPRVAYTALPDRGVLRVSGEDRVGFLQGLVSNDVAAVAPDRAIYACLLTPQGKFLHDFFLIADGDSLLIECEAPRRNDLMRRLKTFKLRSKVEIADATDRFVVAALIPPRASGERDGERGPIPSDGIVFDDPRLTQLGGRALLPTDKGPSAFGISPLPFEDYDRLRIANAVPDGSRDMEVGKAILLENNIDLLNGIAWDKGCYMGQELTARTRYRGLVKKRLVTVEIDGRAPGVGAPLIEDGREVGEMRSSIGNLGLALLRLEAVRENRPLHVGEARLTPRVPSHLRPVLLDSAEV